MSLVIIITAFANISCHAATLKVARSPRLCLCKRFICSLATPHQLLLSTSSILAANTFFPPFAFSFLFFPLQLRTQKMSLFSWKSVRRGSNQQLSFLDEPRAFLRKAPELSAFMLSFSFFFSFFSLLLRITEPSVNCFRVNSSSHSFAVPCKSY